MNHLFSLLFILLFCWQNIGVYLCFNIKEQDNRSFIKKELSKSANLENLKIRLSDKKEIIWLSDAEFIYHSNFYDCKTYNETKEFIKIQCINDTNEKNINNLFSKELNNNENQGNDSDETSNTILSSILDDDYIEKPFTIRLTPCTNFESTKQFNSNYLDHYSFSYLQKSFKPPIFSISY